MTQIDDILEQAKSMIPETYTVILAREVLRLREEVARLRSAIGEGVRPYYEGGHIWAKPLETALRHGLEAPAESEPKATLR